MMEGVRALRAAISAKCTRLLALGLATVTIAVLGWPFVDPLTRGVESPEALIARYLQAVSTGDETSIRRLMPVDREDQRAIHERIVIYRGVDPQRTAAEYVRHQDASYIMTAKITVDGRAFDELVLVQRGQLWYLGKLIEPAMIRGRRRASPPHSARSPGCSRSDRHEAAPRVHRSTLCGGHWSRSTGS